jgi:hypothetical protein
MCNVYIKLDSIFELGSRVWKNVVELKQKGLKFYKNQAQTPQLKNLQIKFPVSKLDSRFP